MPISRRSTVPSSATAFVTEWRISDSPALDPTSTRPSSSQPKFCIAGLPQ
jgi:hypothetical protein